MFSTKYGTCHRNSKPKIQGHTLETCAHRKIPPEKDNHKREAFSEKGARDNQVQAKEDKIGEQWQQVVSKKGKDKLLVNGAGKLEWRAKPAPIIPAWKEGPGESSNSQAKPPVSPGTPQATIIFPYATTNTNKADHKKAGTYSISDPYILSAFTLRHLHENVVRAPILYEVPDIIDNSLAIVPFEGFALPEDDVPDIGFFKEPEDIDDQLKQLDALLSREDFPPLKDSISQSPKDFSSRTKAVIEDEQILSCCFNHLGSSSSLWISSVYGRHTRADRVGLWNSMRNLHPIQGPWIIGGDFNTVASIIEHKGAVCPDLGSMDDFNKAIADCDLISPSFFGSQFTWFGNRGRGRVCRRLDRILINEVCLDLFHTFEVKHLGRGNSDHRPLFLNCLLSSRSGPKPFKFLNVWNSHPTYRNLLISSWDKTYHGGGMRGLVCKLSNFKATLLTWNKETFGNLFQDVKDAEKRAEQAEEKLEQENSQINLLEFKLATALLQQALKKEESFWAQKANIRWISQGDASTAFFHSFVKGRRHRLCISSLKDDNGKLHNTLEGISKVAVDHYSRVFSTVHEGDMGQILDHIPNCVSPQDNSLLRSIPDEEEIRRTIWSLNANSTAGPDGFNGFFFRDSWDIIKIDVCRAVQEFFVGIPMPKAFGSTLITLIPKQEGSITLDQFRPISLSTFFSKIISRLLSERLKTIIPKLISQEQAAFQVGKNITEHVLMVKEMVHILSAKGRGGNCIIKLDLSKAFDKLSWTYLDAVLTKFGFSPPVVHLLMGNLRETHFSVLVNGQPQGFFSMKCRVKQGDPLSPLLFIIALEGLSRFLNHQFSLGYISQFSAGRNFTPCHVLYADDIILFTKADSRNLLRLRELLSLFMKASGQEINYSKSQVIVHERMKAEQQNQIRKILSIRCHTKEFTYLGSNIVKGKLRKVHCKTLVEKFEKKINAWYSKKLNQMGRLILIKHVLSSIPLHLMAAQRIPKSILKSLNRLMANYFWGINEEGPKYHWRKWEKFCFPFEEGGLGLRNLLNSQDAAYIDLWWKVVTGNSIWGKFMKSKYFRDGLFSPKIYDSYTWKAICKISPLVLPHCSFHGEDVAWLSGTYSFKTAYSLTFEHKPKMFTSVCIWDKRQMGKISIFLWRFLNKLLPFPQNLQKMGIMINTPCPFCDEPDVDEQHIFVGCSMYERRKEEGDALGFEGDFISDEYKPEVSRDVAAKEDVDKVNAETEKRSKDSEDLQSKKGLDSTINDNE
ncbi:unnamed protein product [Cuscuta campestris]|uniref:Reverse transcriptase domain-containing protein n=1 Tax=Cuscuta campestris TaxID=132261 RepID=A0A484KXV8_9ASTE|nr:unnamed protein product [Cuscuta campestris]